jgi:hypothetical protein
LLKEKYKGGFAVTDCTAKSIEFPACKRRKVEAQFNGGDVTSDGGVMLLRQADRRLKLSERMAVHLNDWRRQKSCQHALADLLRQRLYGLALGYEDLNDHDTVRKDPGIQTAVGRDRDLASSPTLCRFENRVDRQEMVGVSKELVEVFIDSFEEAPKELILDFDGTDDAVHGKQEGRFFHGYYDHYCFLPLYVFCGDQLLTAYLRPSRIDGAKHAWAILSLLVKRFRREWPDVRIIFRGDSGFCRHKMLSWCERHDVDYIVGLAKNARLTSMAQSYMEQAEADFDKTGQKQRLFGEMRYGAATWKVERRVIVKAEHSSRGKNPRFVVTNIAGEARELYDNLYCARGEMENRIKEQQLCLFSDRTSCHGWWANQFRLLLSAMAYTLLEAIRRYGLHGTELGRARCDTIRLKLLKIGAVIIRNSRRVRFLLSSAHPWQEMFFTVAGRLKPD